MAASFKRLWSQPRRALRQLTPRSRWLIEQSRARFERRPDAYLSDEPMFQGEVGVIETFRFITI